MVAESKIQPVPFIFRKPDNHLYPVDNWPDFEYWFSQNVNDEEIKGDRIYLPVLFTSFYKTANYGENKSVVNILQNFLNTLDRTKKYFCVCQWDNGILNNISHLDIKVFSMAGGRKDYGLPLIAQPHKLIFNNNKKDIFCSFVGRITNPIRQEIVNAYTGKSGYYVSTNHHHLPDYCRILARSIFTLAIRGYSATSFRIMEAIEMGSIPVYVSDLFYEPHGIDFNTYGIKIHSSDYKDIDRILKSISNKEIEEKQKMLPEIFEKYYSFEGCKKLILENI